MAKYLALDLGTKTIGIAKSSGFFANPLTTLRFESDNLEMGVDLFLDIFNQEKPDKIAVGYPRNMDGSLGHRVEMVEEYIEIMNNKGIDSDIIFKVDERLTTKMARGIMIEADLSRKKQKQKKDELAAVLILETFLQQLQNQ